MDTSQGKANKQPNNRTKLHNIATKATTKHKKRDKHSHKCEHVVFYPIFYIKDPIWFSLRWHLQEQLTYVTFLAS